MHQSKKEYSEYAKKRAKRSPVLKNCISAFLVGGLICALGEALFYLYSSFGIDDRSSYTLVSVTIIFISGLLTGLGVFENIARVAGAGTLDPVSGFANAVVSPAIDTKSEGLILGVGAKIFTVAGPVILYATLSGTIYGVIYYFYSLFLNLNN